MVPPLRPLLRCAWIAAAILTGAAPAPGQDADDAPTANPRAFARPDAADATEAASDGPVVLRPTYIFRGPVEPEAIRERLARPDLVILGLEEYERLRSAASADTEGRRRPPEAVVEAVRLEGEVLDGLARLRVRYRMHVNRGGPVWIPVRLDGLTVTSAAEQGRDLPIRVREDEGEAAGWEVRLEGEGEHLVEFGLILAVRIDASTRRLEVPIRPAISTAVRLDVPPGAAEAQAGSGDRLEVRSVEVDGEARDRIEADGLIPRDVLAVSWRSAPRAEASAPPLLSARGDIALEVNRGVVMTRSTWSVQCLRGDARRIELRLDDRSEELLTVELDDRPVPVGEAFDPDSGSLTVELPEPLRSGDPPRRLTMITRRPLPTEISARFPFRGFRMVHAAEQSGVLALVQGEDLWVTATAGAGLRQINPLTDLPESLRARPKVVLAYRFIEQPFDLQIRSDPAPPTAEVEIRSTMAVEPRLARIETELAYAVTRGRLSELRVGIPDGLELVDVGPSSVVESSRTLDEEASDAESPPGRTLVVRLTERARAAGATFLLRLSGRQELVPGDTVRIGLFRPLDGTPRSRQIAVLAAPSLSVGLAEGAAGGPFRPVTGELTPDWPRSADPVAAAMTPEFWLWTDLDVRAVPLQIATRSVEVRHETVVRAEIDISRRDLRQETTCRVLQGSLDHVDVRVPPELEGRWELDGDEVVARELLGKDPDGAVRYRLILGRRTVDLLRLRFLARLPQDPRLSVDHPTSIAIPWIRVLAGAPSPAKVEVAADPGIRLEPIGAGWHEQAGGVLEPGVSNAPPVRLSWADPGGGGGPPRVAATAPSPIDLPPMVASRLWLRTHEGLDGGRQSTAWYRVESHRGAFAASLPTGSVLVRAQVGHDPVEPERVGGGIRLRLPTEYSGALLVRLDFRTDGEESRSVRWEPPRLLGGGVVQETLWEVYIPWSRAVVGTPAGWVDESRWYWAGYVWKRRPALTPAELAGWIESPAVRGRVEEAGPETRWSGYHSYMFGRSGDPASLAPTILPRALLVAACSGLALGLGVVLLLLGPASRPAAVFGAGAAIALAAAIRPDVMLLAGQSAAAGVLLTALAAATKRFVDLRRAAIPAFGEASRVSELVASSSGADPRGSSRELDVSAPGSDDSTVIRRRPPTTIDYVPISQRRSGEPE